MGRWHLKTVGYLLLAAVLMGALALWGWSEGLTRRPMVCGFVALGCLIGATITLGGCLQQWLPHRVRFTPRTRAAYTLGYYLRWPLRVSDRVCSAFLEWLSRRLFGP